MHFMTKYIFRGHGIKSKTSFYSSILKNNFLVSLKNE